MKTFEIAQQRRLIEELREAFVSAYPDRCRELGSEALKTLLWKGLAKADSYGLLTVGETAAFIDLTLNLKPEFDADPSYEWARKILKMPKLRGAAKIAMIQRQLATKEESGDGAT